MAMNLFSLRHLLFTQDVDEWTGRSEHCTSSYDILHASSCELASGTMVMPCGSADTAVSALVSLFCCGKMMSFPGRHNERWYFGLMFLNAVTCTATRNHWGGNHMNGHELTCSFCLGAVAGLLLRITNGVGSRPRQICLLPAIGLLYWYSQRRKLLFEDFVNSKKIVIRDLQAVNTFQEYLPVDVDPLMYRWLWDDAQKKNQK